MTLLGGMSRPVVAEEMLTAAEKFLSKPSFFMSGAMKPPLAAAAAAAEPEIAPKSMFARIFT